MMPTLGGSPPSSRHKKPLILLVIILALTGAAVWYLSRPVNPSANLPVLTPEAKAYTKYLQLSGVQMKATANALGQTLVEITGQITNTGNRPLKKVVLQCIFYDPSGQVIDRELVPIVRVRHGALQPGQTRNFRLPFDSLPKTWNQAMPQLVIAEIIFG